MLSLSFSNIAYQRSVWCVQHSSAAAVKSFISSTAKAPQPRGELKWVQYEIYGVILRHKFELQVNNIEEIKQQQLRRTINTADEMETRDFRVSMFSQVKQRH